MNDDLLNGIPRVDPTSEPTLLRRAVSRFLATKTGSTIHRKVFAPLEARLIRLTNGRLLLRKARFLLSCCGRRGRSREFRAT